jgi:uncharacterized repeat protein (TIGR01451 family)
MLNRLSLHSSLLGHRRKLVNFLTLLALAMSFASTGAHTAVAQVPEPPLITPVAPASAEPDPAPTDAQPAQLEVEPAPSPSDPNVPQVQGVVTLDVTSSPDTIHAGDLITYVFRYQNTGGSTAAGIILDTSFTNFGSGGTNWQNCEPTTCTPQAVSGPAVTKATTSTSGVNARYLIGDLASGESGQFSLALRTFTTLFPKTGKAVTRPAGSGKLYLNNITNPLVSDDTSNTLIVGPVLILTKTITSGVKIYTGETVDYVLRLGNATGPGDVITGAIRADAEPATSVVLKEVFPAGTTVISASDGGVIDNAARTVIWQISVLNPGQLVERRIVFQKADVNSDCLKVSNNNYTVTSNEYPRSGTSRFVVSGPTVAATVVPPVQVKSFTASPATIYFGDPGTVSILVQNFYPRTLNNMQLRYSLQPNLFYAGGATPAPTATPTNGQAGGEVLWTFNMPAGSLTAPSSALFSVQVKADFRIENVSGVAQVTQADGLPTACARKDVRVSVKPRLIIGKYADVVDALRSGGTYFVERDTAFPYLIKIENHSSTDVTGLDVLDSLPASNSFPANFRYAPGSATLNDALREPDTIVDGNGGSLTWSGISVPAGGTVYIRYRLLVDGIDYVRYCNLVSASLNNDEDITSLSDQVCVKVNPRVRLTKTADKSVARPNEEVRFTLRLRNDEPIPYQRGLADGLDNFSYTGVQESGYATPDFAVGLDNILVWPLKTLQPGEEISATIVARMPTICTQRSYANEALFVTPEGIVRYDPRILVSVTCGNLEYAKTASRATMGLRDQITYTLSVRNTNTAAAEPNVLITDVLPSGFTFVAMEPSSVIKTIPTVTTRADGRRVLMWKVPSIDKNATTTVKFRTQSGDTVGKAENLLIVSAPGSPGGRCTQNCKSYAEEFETLTYATATTEVQSLITISPEIADKTCARTGDTRIFKLAILNTNTRGYAQIQAQIKLPLGLKFMKPVGTTPAPALSTEADGTNVLQWNNLEIGPKPANVFAAQVVLEVELVVGNADGNFETLAFASNPDSTIPRKDGVDNPILLVCLPATTTLAKDVSKTTTAYNSEVVYQISLANPTSSTLTTSLVDILPGEFVYIRSISGPVPTVDSNTLTWTDVGVPAGVVLKIKFVARAKGAPGSRYINTVEVVDGTTPIGDSARNAAETTISLPVFIPLIFR